MGEAPAPHSGFWGEPELRLWARVANAPFVLAIKAYQFTLSPILGRSCRYHPTCSWFGLTAYRRFGPVLGTWLTVGRILRCHPMAKGGFDPVPLAASKECKHAPGPTPGSRVKGQRAEN